jgi:hypothetical protein
VASLHIPTIMIKGTQDREAVDERSSRRVSLDSAEIAHGIPPMTCPRKYCLIDTCTSNAEHHARRLYIEPDEPDDNVDTEQFPTYEPPSPSQWQTRWSASQAIPPCISAYWH